MNEEGEEMLLPLFVPETFCPAVWENALSGARKADIRKDALPAETPERYR